MYNSESEKNWAIFIHLSFFLGFIIPLLGFLAPVLFWQIKKNDSTVLDQHGKSATNLVINCILTYLGAMIISLITGIIYKFIISDPFVLAIGVGITYAIVFVVGLYWIISSIIASVKASQGIVYQQKFVKKFLK